MATDDFQKDPAAAQIFLNNGAPWAVGQKSDPEGSCRNAAIDQRSWRGRLLQGRPVADAIVASSKAHNGIIVQADLDRYKPRELAPIECDYRGYHIVSAPPPSSGGVVICEILNILEGYPLGDLGWGSARAIHYEIEAMRHSYVDRNNYLGDPDFVKNPIDRLTSKDYAAKIRSVINPDKAGISAELQPRHAAARRQQHDALFDRRQMKAMRWR